MRMRTVWVYLDGHGANTETIYFNEPPKKEHIPSEKRYLFDETELRRILRKAALWYCGTGEASTTEECDEWLVGFVGKLIEMAAND